LDMLCFNLGDEKMKKLLREERKSCAELLREQRAILKGNTNMVIVGSCLFRIEALDKKIQKSDVECSVKFKKFMRLENIKSLMKDLAARLKFKTWNLEVPF